MARLQCNKFKGGKDKVMLVKVTWLDLGIPDGKAAQTTIPNTAAFQTEDLDAYDSNYDDVSNVKVVLVANLSNYDSDVISERKRDAMWFRDKVLLVKAQGNGKALNEEELEFLADPGIVEGPVIQLVITYNVAYQADDLDAYDSDCNEISTAKAVLIANLSSYGLDVLFKYLLETQNAAVHDTNYSAQQNAIILSVFEKISQQVTNWNKVNKDNLMANETLSAELERYKERVKLLEERQNVDLGTREKLIIDDIIRDKDAQFADFEKEINSLKQTLSEQLKEK
ncbi:hypothetical protein Tco_1459436 [Tanacetum coccineum]